MKFAEDDVSRIEAAASDLYEDIKEAGKQDELYGFSIHGDNLNENGSTAFTVKDAFDQARYHVEAVDESGNTLKTEDGARYESCIEDVSIDVENELESRISAALNYSETDHESVSKTARARGTVPKQNIHRISQVMDETAELHLALPEADLRIRTRGSGEHRLETENSYDGRKLSRQLEDEYGVEIDSRDLVRPWTSHD